MAFFIVNEEFYFAKKLESLQNDEAYKAEWTGKTVVDLKAFFEANGLTAQQHFDEFGWAEQLSANAEFDVAAYFAAKAKQTGLTVEEVIQAFKDNGLTVATHYEKYGKAEIEAGELDFTPGATAPSTLTEALAALKAAQEAKTAFLLAAGQDEEVEGEEPAATEAEIETAFDEALDDVEDVLTSAPAAYKVAGTGYADASANVRPVMISDAKEALNAALAAAEKKVADKQAEIAKVTGLTSAISTYESAVKAEAAATKALAAATLAKEAEILKFNKLNGTGKQDTDAVEKKDGVWVLKSGLKASDFTGIDALLSALNSFEAATTADINADTLVVETLKAVNFIDKTDDTKTKEATVANLIKSGDTTTTLKAIQAHSNELVATAQAAIRTELSKPDALVKLKADKSGYEIYEDAEATTPEIYAGSNLGAANTFQAAVNGLNTELEKTLVTGQMAFDLNKLKLAITNPAAFDAAGDFVPASAGVKDFITALEAAIAAETEANDAVNTLKSLNEAIEAAEKAFADLGLELPVTVGETNIATSEADVFIAGEVSGSITNFGVLGDDLLFIGKDFTLNTGALKDGNASVLEVFFIQKGADAQVVLETKPYGSNEANVAEVTITLTGVKATDLTLTEDGFVTLA